ncbi:citrate synthase, mitochondrial isoform X1 [Lactuca sativa]|uniref:citrate synthase, mitochondrial isoform X1 n=2 Tax=Lactuca sativa TaxID=4236 RepID=UPI001C68EA51|nr:citrate synthase, mitochondrial isoform X1 [Lactuca sativa]
MLLYLYLICELFGFTIYLSLIISTSFVTNFHKVLGGMRGMTGLLWEISLLDPNEKVLPAAKPGVEPLPEGLLWLLLTRKVPTIEQVNALSKELRSRATIPDHVYKAINALPITTHPMTEFTTGVMALQVQSEFAKAYENGIHKSKVLLPHLLFTLQHKGVIIL